MMHRLLPCLTIFENKLIKTINFNIKNSNYIGDPLNAVKIFNEKKAEEIIVLDIGATIKNTSPNFDLIKKISSVSRMPVCYGGGIKNIEQAREILSYGIEKISISSAIFDSPSLIDNLVTKIGKQSVSVTIDIKKIDNEYIIFTHNAKKRQSLSLIEYVKIFKNNVGEIILNNIDLDGTMNGIDKDLIGLVYNEVNVPIVVLGGFGNIKQIKDLFNNFDVIGAACGSLFIYKGDNKAVLINYPIDKIKNKIVK